MADNIQKPVMIAAQRIVKGRCPDFDFVIVIVGRAVGYITDILDDLIRL